MPKHEPEDADSFREDCPECAGTGCIEMYDEENDIPVAWECPECEGTAWVEAE